MTLLTAAEVSERARAFLAAVSVAPDVFELRPDYRVLVMVAEGLEPGPPDQISEELLARAEIRAAVDDDFGTTAHGEPATEHPRPGEVIWRDDAGVTCRQWNWRQCTRTRITTATTNAVFIIDGLAALGRDGLTAAGNDLASSLIRLSPRAAIASRLITADQPHANRRTHTC